MLKKLLFGSLSCIFLVCLFSSCNVSIDRNDKENLSDTSETNEQITLAHWKTAYLDFLQVEKQTYDSYALIYIDNDDIPELYMSGIGEAEGDSVCSYKNGKVIEQKLHRLGGGRYIEKSGEFINQNGHMGNYHTHVFALTNNEFVLTFSALSEERIVFSEKNEYELHNEYFVGEKTVSESEYKSKVENSFDFTSSKRFDENAVEYDEIKMQIINFE